MSGRPDNNYALQKVIERAIRAAKAAGLDVGGFDVRADGTVRILTKGEAQADAFSDWKRERANAG